MKWLVAHLLATVALPLPTGPMLVLGGGVAALADGFVPLALSRLLWVRALSPARAMANGVNEGKCDSFSMMSKDLLKAAG